MRWERQPVRCSAGRVNKSHLQNMKLLIRKPWTAQFKITRRNVSKNQKPGLVQIPKLNLSFKVKMLFLVMDLQHLQIVENS